MNKKLCYLMYLFVAVFISCKNKQTDTANKKEVSLDEISLDVVDFDGFKPYLEKNDSKVYVINFWATWCAPCVKELPYFEKLNTVYSKSNVEVILVSLDFPHVYEKKLKPFILEKKIKSRVIALDDVDGNSWIPKVNENWSGSIPATVIYKNGNSKFFEQSFTYEELEGEVKQFLN